MEDTVHIFVCQGWHVYNEMFPFFECLQRKNKFFFTDVHKHSFEGLRPLIDIYTFKPNSKKGIIYFSIPNHIAEYRFLKLFSKRKIVRIFHGVLGGWRGTILDKKIPCIDLVTAISRLDKELLNKYRPEMRVEIMGWPKAEALLSSRNSFEAKPNTVFVGTNWSKERSAFNYCKEISCLCNRKIIFSLHPNLFDWSRPLGGRLVGRVDVDIVKDALGILKNEDIKFTDPKNGVLDYMAECEIMLGVESSTSFEWLLFNRPIIFLKDSPFLRHGLYINTYSINKAIDIALKEDLFQEIRLKLRNKLISHLDGLYYFRFNNLVDELELQL